MIKIADYLNYLNAEVIQARKKADEYAIEMAKQYASHEYLKYFRVPRFTMPVVNLNIPIKIDELAAKTKYQFQMDEDSFVTDVNERIHKSNSENGFKLKKLTKEELLDQEMLESIKKLESEEHPFVKNLDQIVNKVELEKSAKNQIKKTEKASSEKSSPKLAEEEMKNILKEAIKAQFHPVSAKLNEIFVDPNTSKENDKGKILLNLEVELVEEGIRIRTVKDSNGKEVEEIIFE